MEIGGYPHYENVCSNFLAFFLDPEGPHGMGSLFFEALLVSAGVASVQGDSGQNVSVEREAGTAMGNRIDILMTSDSRAVLVENKIHAAAVNPFEDYAKHLDGLKNEGGEAYEEKVKILLTLYPSREGAGWGFVNVTHADLTNTVRSSLGHRVSAADTRYLTLMLDFLNTLENLGEGTRMDHRYIALLAERGEEVTNFLRAVREVRRELRAKVQALAPLIGPEGHHGVDIEQIPWSPNQYHTLVHLLQHRVRIDEQSYAVVEPVITPNGWETRTYQRVFPETRSSVEISEFLEAEGIPRQEDTVSHEKRFGYEEDLSSVASFVREELGRTAALVRRIRDEASRSAG